MAPDIAPGQRWVVRLPTNQVALIATVEALENGHVFLRLLWHKRGEGDWHPRRNVFWERRLKDADNARPRDMPLNDLELFEDDCARGVETPPEEMQVQASTAYRTMQETQKPEKE